VSQPAETSQPGNIVAPHGGALVDRFISEAEASVLVNDEARQLPILTLGAREKADLELIATGAASPLTGFLGSADYQSVLSDLRLANGVVWPLPVTLAVGEDVARRLRAGSPAALVDAEGRLWGTLLVSDVFERDVRKEALAVYGTDDPKHPGVATTLAGEHWLVGGDVRVLPLPKDLPFAENRLTPRALRARILERGWRRVAGFQTRNPIHRAHEHLTKLALELCDGLVVHPLVGETKGDDVPASVRFRVYETLLDRYYPRERTLLAAFPAAMRYAGPREALFHALVRKNYGISHLIVGRDHAGVGSYYGPFEAQEIFERFRFDELGVAPLKFDSSFFCRPCGGFASERTCPHDRSARLELSGTKVRQILSTGGRLPREFTRPETAEILKEHYASVSGEPSEGSPALRSAAVAAPSREAAARKGFVLWLTGLSGAGKSTLAAALREGLEGDLPVEILDGDEVRTYLSKGLGFSKEDRDTNVRRIGYVARLLAKNGVAVITAAISPYAETRNEVRRLAEADGVPFVEVFVHADLEVLVSRDVKGLYKKALAGEVAHFTGVSDPYEPPSRPEVVVRSDREGVEDSAARVLEHLEANGLAAPLREELVA